MNELKKRSSFRQNNENKTIARRWRQCANNNYNATKNIRKQLENWILDFFNSNNNNILVFVFVCFSAALVYNIILITLHYLV